MFQHCLETLERIAQPHDLARRWARRAFVPVGTIVMILAAQSPVYADAPPESRNDISAWKIDDANPEASIPTEKDRNRDPVQFGYWLMDLTARAGGAAKRGDHAASIRYYTALAKAVPDESVAFTKLCDEYVAANQHAEAVAACGLALFRHGVTDRDYLHYMNLILTAPGKLNAKEIAALAAVIAHLREDPKEVALADELECEAGVRTSNAAELEECTLGMVAREPNEPKTIVYQWNLAMQHHQYDQARQLLERAKTTEMKPEAIARMETETSATVERRAETVWLAGGALFVLAVGAFVTAKTRRRRRVALQPV